MSYRVRFRREVVELGGKDRELVRGGGHKKEEDEEKEVDAVSKREVLFGYICSRSRNFFMKKSGVGGWENGDVECERDEINAISNVLFQSVTSYVCMIQLTTSSFSLRIIVALKLPRAILLFLLTDRVFILLRSRATRVPAFGFARVAIVQARG